MSDSGFTDLLKPHYNDAVNYCRALCSGATMAEAEDVMQQALLKAYENRDTLRDKEKFRSWFFQILTRCFYNTVRKPFWSRFVSLNNDHNPVPFQVFEEDFFEENQQLMLALNELSKKERAAVLLFEIGGFSIKEITGMQGENSESAVKSRLSRAREKLKEFMVAEEQTAGKVSRNQRSAPDLKTNDLHHETVRLINDHKTIR